MKKISFDRLLALNLKDVEIIYRRCRRESVKKIALEMSINESTLWNVRLPQIHRALGFEKWEEVEKEFCLPLTSTIPALLALRGGWPEAFREKLEVFIEKLEASKEVSGSTTPPQPPTEPQTPSNEQPIQTAPIPAQLPEQPLPGTPTDQAERGRRHRAPWIVPGVSLLILCLLCISAVIGSWGPIVQALSRLLTPQPQPISTTPVSSTEAPQATFTVRPPTFHPYNSS